jgi:peptidoglycan/xylan/chitin deacetylase (PgdA/CDA1 family)
MFYLAKTPGILKKIYPDCIWNFSKTEPVIYLTFDDGPHPLTTPFILETLRQFNARATFFCIGKNVAAHPALYKQILNEGHSVGNHTNNHLNGWKTPDQEYIQNIKDARKYIDSNLFRPPYGRITKFQIRLLTAAENSKQPTVFRIIMWDVLSGDFDESVSPEKCSQNVIRNAGEGSIVVFHDSEKAYIRLQKGLPDTLKYFTGKGFRFEAIGI